MIGRYSDEMTFDYIMNRMLESVPDTVDKREGSIIYDALAPAAAELVKCYMELDVVMDETFVDTASLQYLMLRCKERGVAIQGETAAVIEGVFTPSSVELTAGLRFNCDEVNYVVTEKISAGHYKLEAETLGTVGNKYTGLLLPIQTVNGLDTAQIAAVLIPAEDGDTTDTLREKYYASIDGEAFGGNVADYREKVNAITGVGGTKVYPVWNGGGTVKLTIIASDYTAPSTELISKVQTAIDPEQNHGEGLGFGSNRTHCNRHRREVCRYCYRNQYHLCDRLGVVERTVAGGERGQDVLCRACEDLGGQCNDRCPYLAD